MLNIASIVSRLKVPLPPVSSRAAFTHTSLHSARRQAVEAPEGEEILDYDRLEHFGDAVVNFSAAKLIHTFYPRLTPGASTTLRKTLVCNETLALLSAHFGLHERLQASQAQMADLRANSDVRADLFEAYIGALYDEKGPGAADEFLESVFGPVLAEAYEVLRRNPEQGDSLVEAFAATQLGPHTISTAAPSPPLSTPPPLPSIHANYIGRLKEWCDQLPLRRHMEFSDVEARGAGHALTQYVRLEITDDKGERRNFEGQDNKVKAARSMAAREACAHLKLKC